MKLVVDANILFAALLKNGWSRQLWVTPGLELVAPAYLMVEFESHRSEIFSKFKGSREDFDSLFRHLIAYVKLVEDAELKPYVAPVMSLSSDSDDWLYLACALFCGGDLWSSDKGFQPQKRFRVWRTDELIDEFGPAP